MIRKSISFRSIFSDRVLDAHQSSDAEQVTKKKSTFLDPEFSHQFHFSVGFKKIPLTARLQPYVKSIWLIATIGMVLTLAGIIRSRNHNIQSQYHGKPVSNQSVGLVSLADRAPRPLLATSLKQRMKIGPEGYGISHSIGLLKNGASPAEEVCGGINVPTTWSAPVIVITCNVSVGEGGVLTILPGTVVKFNTDPVYGKGTLWVGRGGKLYAQGTESEPVVFTSYLDDEHGGDTNQDGISTPHGGDWAKIEFRSGYGRISHAWIGYGAGYQTNWSLPKGMVVASRDGSAPLKESDVILDHVTLTKSGHHAIVTSYSSLTIRNSQIYDNPGGINTCIGMGCSGVPPIVDARYNWWGHPSGPFVCDYYSNPLGEGDSVCGGGVLFYPWIGDISTYGMLPAHFTLSGPNTASAGQVVDYAITYRSSPTTTVENAIALVVLPTASSYVTSTHGGTYWPERNEVFWKLDDLPPNSEGSLSVEVEIYWGITEGTSDSAMALMAGSNWGQTAFDVAPYLTYTPTKVLDTHVLTEDDLIAERAAYPDFDLLFTEAISDGFTFGDINRITLSAGEVITQVVLVHKENDAVMFLRRPEGEATAVTYDPTSLTVRTSTGGMRFDVQTGKTEYLDFDGSATSYESLLNTCQLTEGQCLFNCMLDLVSGTLTGKIKAISNTLTSIDCVSWITFGDENSRTGCLLSIAGNSIQGVSEVLGVGRCSDDCANPATRDLHVCTGEKVTCESGGLLSDISGLLPPEFFVLSRSITYDCIDNCRYDYGSGDYCRGGTKCVKGKGCVECWGPSATSQDFKEAAQEACLVVQQTGGFCDYCSTDYTIAHDPNAKHGVIGELLPGQLITYTLEYENEGSGTAYGVFVVDELDEDLDDTTLTLSEGGNYITDTRTLLWDIGNLNPVGQVGSSGVVTFTVGISDGAPGGTIIFNQATIYFPSAQEETPTNPVVNIVQPVIAEPQSVETTYTQSIPITLSGKDVSSAALTYNVVEGPSFGELTGSPPDLTYTPMENHIGLDKFSFTANNGITESLPALIQIQVHPSPDDTTPPQVLWTSPDDGEVIEQIDALPIITGAAGPMYSPLIIVQFSEPLSSTTVTTATVTMISSSENNVKVIPGYDAASRRIMIYSGEPWQTSGYTVTLKQGITDASGNPLQADHLWSFEMVAAESPYEYIFLPLIEQQ